MRSRFRSAYAVLLFGLLTLPSAVRAEAEDAFRKGIQASERGRWQEAVLHLKEAITQDPQEADRRILITGV